MKTWQTIVLGVLIGCGLMAIIFLVVRQPQGAPLTLKPAPTPSPLLVHITGCVTAPGVYELPPKSHIRDAVTMAGGLTDCANQDSINLAATLSDGQKIVISPYTTPMSTNDGFDKATSSEQAITSGSSPININTASLQELQTLPGIGEVKALSIITYRDQYGSFFRIEDLLKVSGIGEKTLEQIKDLITLGY
jgi:competence protein ComEA